MFHMKSFVLEYKLHWGDVRGARNIHNGTMRWGYHLSCGMLFTEWEYRNKFYEIQFVTKKCPLRCKLFYLSKMRLMNFWGLFHVEILAFCVKISYKIWTHFYKLFILKCISNDVIHKSSKHGYEFVYFLNTQHQFFVRYEGFRF